MDTTGVRAGIIKIAANAPQLTDWEKRVFRAAAKAHLQTGACITTHAVSGCGNQAEELLEAGADLTRVFFSHIEAEFGWEGRGLHEQADYLTAVARQGGALLFNNFGFEFDTPWEDLTFLVRHLCDAGCADKVLMSVDCNGTWNDDGRIEFEAERDHPDTARRTFAYMITDAVPALLEAGFGAEDVQTCLVDNPRRFFERSGGT